MRGADGLELRFGMWKPAARFALVLAGPIALAIGATGAAPQSTPAAPLSGIPISIDAVSVPLNPQRPSDEAIGDFRYAGGLVLTSRQTDQLHGLSDIEVRDHDRLTAVSDLGNLLEARLVLDGSERLVGLADARMTPLTDEEGKPLSDKADADAEGLALLPGGDRLVSFERRDRVWRYPVGGGPPKPAPKPAASFPLNGGLEAVAADPEAGLDAYIVGAEVTGDTWSCRLSSPSCGKGPTVAKPQEFGLVGIRRLPGMRAVYLLRAFDEKRGSRNSLQVFRGTAMIARLDLAPPMTVDNFEGIAAVPQPDGRIRFYLISDDNAVDRQRTILLAFDWRPR
jgi:hypothetical protein